MTHNYLRSSELLCATSSRLVIIDMQSRFAPIIPDFDLLVNGCRKLIRTAELMGIPVSTTEQYSKGLGATVPELAELLPVREEKLRFSSAECLPWVGEHGLNDGRRQILLAGIETHVCMLQTALDLIAAGFDVYVSADLSRSRKEIDREFALKRMADAGVRIVTSEMAIFEWCETAANPLFKQLSSIVKSD